MTYIKWKDEVESYLGNLSASEKQKVFSYFAEMYADKRDAGLSEESIIESFGAPYDVARRILADNKDNPAQAAEGGAGNSGSGGNSGGNNYNYNYYNYNYGGAPPAYPAPNSSPNTAPAPQSDKKAEDKGGAASEHVDVSDIDMPLPEGTPKPKEEKGRNAVATVFLTIGLIIASIALVSAGVGITIGFFSAAIGCAASGIATIIDSAYGLASGLGTGQIGLMGSGFIEIGIGIIFLPLAILVVKLLWKFIAWVLKQFKEALKA